MNSYETRRLSKRCREIFSTNAIVRLGKINIYSLVGSGGERGEIKSLNVASLPYMNDLNRNQGS